MLSADIFTLSAGVNIVEKKIIQYVRIYNKVIDWAMVNVLKFWIQKFLTKPHMQTV